MKEQASRASDLPLEEVPCYLCGGTDGQVLVDDPPFVVRLCASCGLGYTSPRLCGDRIHELYDDGYFNSEQNETFGYADYEKDLAAYERTFRRKLRVIGPHCPAAPASVLEVGCAGGAFLKVMEDRGHEVWGVELAPGMLDAARARYGFERLFLGRFDEAAPQLPSGGFGMVAMFDVVEHVPDPVRELRLAHDLLAPDGVLVLQTQDVMSRTRKVMGRRWHHFKQLEHIYHFSPGTLKELLERAGFRVHVLTRRHAGKYVSFAEISDRAHRVGRWPSWLCAPLRWMGRRYLYVNPLDEMLVVARKDDAAG